VIPKKISTQKVQSTAKESTRPHHVGEEQLQAHPNPKNLFVLWQEYEIGLGGCKAAKLFTQEEQGRVKHKYSWQKVVWDCISNLVHAGLKPT
jgi:hypothetical protein